MKQTYVLDEKRQGIRAYFDLVLLLMVPQREAAVHVAELHEVFCVGRERQAGKIN